MARYTVEREDDTARWVGMAETDDLKRAIELAHDSHRRVRDNLTAEIVPIMPSSVDDHSIRIFVAMTAVFLLSIAYVIAHLLYAPYAASSTVAWIAVAVLVAGAGTGRLFDSIAGGATLLLAGAACVTDAVLRVIASGQTKK